MLKKSKTIMLFLYMEGPFYENDPNMTFLGNIFLIVKFSLSKSLKKLNKRDTKLKLVLLGTVPLLP